MIRRAVLVASFILFPITIYYFSPALIIMAAAAGVLSGSAMVFLGQFIAALFFGRAFCGWVCPAGGLQEACFAAQPKQVNRRRVGWIKYAIWIPWMGLISVLLIRHGIHAAQFWYDMDSPISLSSPAQYPVYIVVTGLMFTLALTVGKRGFCHTACWMAPFMIIGEKLQRRLRLPALHLRAAPQRCVGCRQCDAACPMSLPVHAMVNSGAIASADCVLCGNCVDSCTHKAIRYAVGINRTAKAADPDASPRQ